MSNPNNKYLTESFLRQEERGGLYSVYGSGPG